FLQKSLHQRRDDQFRDDDVRGEFGDEEDGGRDVFGLQDALPVDFVDGFRAGVEDGSVHFAGIDAADADAVGLDLGAETKRQRVQAKLGGGIGWPTERAGAHAGDGVDIDDQAAAALGHLRHDFAHAIEGPVHVGADKELPGLRRQLLECPRLDVRAGVIDKDIDGAEAAVYGFDKFVHL